MNIADQKPEDININPLTTTGPGQMSSGGLWPEIERQATTQDLKAQALLELKKSIENELILLKREGEKFRSQLGDYQKSLRRTDTLLIGIVIVVSAAFITTLSLVFFDLIKEKDIYLQNNNLYQNYSNQSNEQKIQINDLNNELKMLRVKNPYLK